jgi:hypothetical protein
MVKINSIFIYINIEVFLGYGNSLSRTATLQRCNEVGGAGVRFQGSGGIT